MHNYTDEERLFIEKNIKGTPAKTLCEMFNKKFGTSLSLSTMRSYCHNHKLTNGINACFKKGCVSFNKGVKMSSEQKEKIKKTWFKKGSKPHNTRPIGSSRVDKGYIYVKVAEPDEWKQKHHIEWEKYNPPVEKNECLIFLDGNPLNCDISNLKKITRSQNVIISKYKMWSKEPTLNETAVNVASLIIKSQEVKKC